MRRRLRLLLIVGALSCVALFVSFLGQFVCYLLVPGLASQGWFRAIVVIPVFLAVLPIAVRLLERDLVFPATTADEDWSAAPNSRFEDHLITLDDGAEVHAWWYPNKDSATAILYCHGNAGNLSQRGEWVCRWQERLGESILIFDYPGYGRSAGTPSEEACVKAGEAAMKWLFVKGIAP
ncbi:MAG: hypothetical protein N2C14_22255, partial [Planctomycetales bacterium]